jgi:hypothetical protein
MFKLPCEGGGLESCDGDELRDFGNSNTDISYHAEGDIVTSVDASDPVEWEPYVGELAES